MVNMESCSIQTKISWNHILLKTGKKKQFSSSSKIFLWRFNLYYYSNATIKEKIDTVLTIDTRNNKIANKLDVELNEDFDPIDENPLEKAIQTK